MKEITGTEVYDASILLQSLNKYLECLSKKPNLMNERFPFTKYKEKYLSPWHMQDLFKKRL